MKNHFNFTDQSINDGFQIDMSLLTDEQRLHVLQMFEARGITWQSDRKATDGWKYYNPNIGLSETKQWLIFQGEVLVYDYNGSFEAIDYPTLCRGAVQLEVFDYAYFEDAGKCNEVFVYSKMAGMYDYKIMQGQTWALTNTGLKTYAKDIVLLGNKLSPEEFEQRLKGIEPVVRENRTTENIGEAVKPKRYLKSKRTGNIVEWVKDTSKKEFSGVVVALGVNSNGYKVGGESNEFHYGYFEPCDYTPAESGEDKFDFHGLNYQQKSEAIGKGSFKGFKPEDTHGSNDVAKKAIEFVQGDSPAVEQPLTPLHAAKNLATGLLFQMERLEKENAQLKAEIQDWQKTNLTLMDVLDKANDRVRELEAQLATLRGDKAEVVYDREWLNNIVSNYNDKYRLCDSGIQVGKGIWVSLSPQDSAHILMKALAKELNGDWDKQGNYEVIIVDTEGNYDFETWSDTFSRGAIKFKPDTAQKAINILTKHFPEVLKNYFA